MDATEQLERELGRHKFVLICQGSHRVYKNPDGKIFVVGLSLDFRETRKALADLRRVLVSPPQPEILAELEYKREHKQESRAAAMANSTPKKNKRARGSFCKTKGTGYGYYDEELPEQTEEQKEQAARATERARREQQERDVVRVAAQARRETAVVKQCLVRARQNARDSFAQFVLDCFDKFYLPAYLEDLRNSEFFYTHIKQAHVDYEKRFSFEEYLERSIEVNKERIINITKGMVKDVCRNLITINSDNAISCSAVPEVWGKSESGTPSDIVEGLYNIWCDVSVESPENFLYRMTLAGRAAGYVQQFADEGKPSQPVKLAWQSQVLKVIPTKSLGEQNAS